MSADIEHDMVTYITTDKPLVVYFRANFCKIDTPPAPSEFVNHIELNSSCNMMISDTWSNLATAMALGPELLIFHHRMILHEGVSVVEFVNMIITLGRYTLPSSRKMRIAVCIGKDCNISFIKELQTTEVVGIIPCNEDFGNDSAAAGITHLISDRSYWPKELIGNFSTNKNAATRTAFHLTDRQQQVLTLVCNRGLSNKKIASLLKISESTVKIHVSAILKEYGVRNRTQLALAANASLRA